MRRCPLKSHGTEKFSAGSPPILNIPINWASWPTAQENENNYIQCRLFRSKSIVPLQSFAFHSNTIRISLTSTRLSGCCNGNGSSNTLCRKNKVGRRLLQKEDTAKTICDVSVTFERISFVDFGLLNYWKLFSNGVRSGKM